LRLIARLALLVLMPLLLLEFAARTMLFQYVSYSNSKSIDRQLHDLRERDDWRIVAIGDSEVRWGFDPVAFDDALAHYGLKGPTFNLAWDGFSSGLWSAVLPALSLNRDAPDLRVVLVGVQLIESHSTISSSEHQPGVCGALQRPVLTSSMGIEHGLDTMCEEPTWRSRVFSPLKHLAIFRYRQAIRTLILGPGVVPAPIEFTSNSLKRSERGYDPHSSYADNRTDSDHNLQRMRAEKATDPKAFEPLPPEAWMSMVARGGYFDSWAQLMRRLGWTPVFFALPTNPILIDEKDRRGDYERNSALLQDWARQNGQIFVDLGIRDHVPMDVHYSDHRHLSVYGAPIFSAELARALCEVPAFRDALR